MTQFIDYIAQLTQSLSVQKQRGIVRLVGSVSECYECIEPLIEHSIDNSLHDIEHLKVIPFLEPELVSNESVLRKNEWRIKKFRKYLGQECDILIYDAYQGFNADAVAALSGVIKQGGLLILITPPDAEWRVYQDPEQSRFISEKVNVGDIENNFITHLLTVFDKNSNNGIYQYNIDSPSPVVSKTIKPLKQYRESIGRNQNLTTVKKSSPYVTADQELAAIAITKLLSAERLKKANAENDILEQCLLVTADRGRGKSSVIGIAVAQWLNQQSTHRPFNIVVTSSSLDSTGILTDHFNRSQSDTNGTIKFYSPDHIIAQSQDFKSSIDLLIIDEAASLPVVTVKELVSLTSKVILATTIHGYEGTGRGFEYKLKPWLKENYKNYRHLTLTQPVRWTENDNLERIINRGVCFTKEVETPASKTESQTQTNITITSNSAQQRTFKKLSGKQLIEKNQVSQVFGLLTEAHYQTSPNDLRAMLDSPNMEIFTLYQGAELVATALISLEGGFEPEHDRNLISNIQKGIRRPRGHLFPQSLLAHCGYSKAGYYKYARVVRIAVDPPLQSQGLGSELLANLESYYCKTSEVDFLCTSFGFDVQVLSFWSNSAFFPVRLGVKADSSTGLESIMMAKALKSDAETDLLFWRQRCYETLKAEISADFRERNKANILALLKSLDSIPPAGYSIWSKNQNWLDLNHLSMYHRSPDSCVLAVQSILSEVSHKSFELLADKFIHGEKNKVLIVKFNYSGEKELVKNIRNQGVSLLSKYLAF